MSRETLSKLLLRVGAIRFGEFTYASGEKGPVYVDLRRLISFPEDLRMLCKEMTKLLLEREKPELLLAAATAGIPFGTLISAESKIPMAYIRKDSKGYGTRSRLEGVWSKGQNAVLIDDLVTSGASKKLFVDGARDSGLNVDSLLVVLDRRKYGEQETLEKLGLRFHSLLSMDDLLRELEGDERVTQQDLLKTELWLKGEYE